MTTERLEAAILLEIVTRFANLKKGTPRWDLLTKFKGQPAWQAIGNLINQNIIRRNNSNAPTNEEEYLPRAAAFQFCESTQLRDQAKFAVTIVLHTLQHMSVGERKKEGFVFEDLKRHVHDLKPDRTFDDETLKLGLYLAQDLSGILAGSRLNPPDDTEVTWFQIGEGAVGMANPDTEWDRVMAGFRLEAPLTADADFQAQGKVQWEEIKRLGGGGQSDVFLVRSPARVSERESYLQTIRTARDQDKKAEFAEAIWSYARPDSLPELGAKKIFKIRDDGGEQQALARLEQEMHVLQQNRPGLPKLLDFSEDERWIVTEYFPRGTVEDNISLYKGKPALALKAFLSLVNTVTLLHDEDIVHRDIKPANVFVRQDEELVLGDFGIVFLPDQPARLTRTNESVGPHDFMPPWADIGGRLQKVDCNFDVYSLGKLLWCMVSGRQVLRREYFRDPENDILVMFREDPHAYMINEILEKCVVERPQNCVGIHDVRAMVIAFVSLIEHGGQLLHKEVPRPCHVCGYGKYQPESLQQSKSVGGIRIWTTGSDHVSLSVQAFACDKCGHVEFFKTAPQ